MDTKKRDIKKYVIGFIVFLMAYYILFGYNKVDLTFSARDLEVKTIDNKKDYENIIVKNIYDKIIESCEQKEDRYKRKILEINDWEGSSDFGFSATKSEQATISDMDFGAENSATFGIDKSASIELKGNSSESSSIGESLSLPSMDFGGNETKEVEKTESVSFSQTNIQKQSVDEGDILKQTKDYVFYFSKSKAKIYIIKSPLNGEKLDLNNIKAIFEINIPANITLKPELFVNDSRLVYLSSKKSYDNNDTIVGIYDISNLKNADVKLLKIFQTKGDYFKSRLINNNLYLISDYSLKPFKDKYCNILKNEKSGFIDFLSFFTGIELKGFGLNEELFNELKNELESYSYKFDEFQNLDNDGKLKSLENFKIFYTNKDLKESIENLNYNVISVVDIDKKEAESSQTLLFGNLQNGEIHMTLDNLYLVNSYYQKEKWKCEYIDICYKQFASNNFTSVAKISYIGKNLTYLKSSIIEGKPINQYSMDEDEGYFRIFTALNDRNRDASLYTFDKNLKLIGSLENIKPGEEFKSARFIEDKAFLVTFRQTDPLFVIDLHIHSAPKIIGELQIPGYSSYLHPYGKVGNKEYLIGIGRESNNVKVDLYEINYDKKDIGGNIEVSQKHKFIFGGSSSVSPAEENPRSFVFDNESKTLYLPININQDYKADNDYMFAGIKALEIKIDKGITEIETKGVKNNPDIFNSRVGYYKDATNKILFFVSELSISFFKDTEDREINFN